MYAIYKNWVDITEFVERKTLNINESLNNQRNTADFSLTSDFAITEGEAVKIYKYSQALSFGSNFVILENLFEFEKRFFVGQEVIVWIWETEEKKIIFSIDSILKKIIFTQNISWNYSYWSKIWNLIFAWTIEKIPDENLWKSDIILRKVSLVDYSSLIDKQNIVDTFVNMYAKEILSRVLYFFTSRDQEKTIVNFESPESFTTWGIATAAAFEAESISWNYSLKVWASWSWNGWYRLNLSSVSISSFEDLRFWVKIPLNILSILNFWVFKIWTDENNYFRFEKYFNEDGGYWNWDNFKLWTPTAKIWIPSLSNITWFAFDFNAKTSFSSWSILLDELSVSNWGFTLNNTQRGNIIFEDVRSNYKKPWEFINNLAKLENFFWYVDYEKDLHYFSAEKEIAPFEITPTSNNYNNLTRTIDISKLKNRQTIRGGQAPDENRYIQERVCDGVEESWALDYPPKDVKVYVDTTGTGSSYIEKSVWVENLVASTSVDYLFNFSEKVVRKSNDSIIPAWGLIKIDYIPYKDIRVRYQDKTSIDRMRLITWGSGVYDGAVITDESIKTFEDARIRAKAEIEAYKNPIITINFETQRENLKAGQLIHIKDTARNIDDFYTIQKIKIKSIDTDNFIYWITAASTLFWYVEFFQLLFKKTEKGQVGINELVDVVLNIDEVLTFTDNFVFTHKTAPFYAMGPTPGETPNDAYADFSETA